MPEKPEKNVPGLSPEGDTLTFDFIKGNQFRVIHADGFHGGTSPKGNNIVFSVFSERWPIPKQVSHSFNKGNVGEEIERVTRHAIVREVEACVVMDLDTAKSLYEWLAEKIGFAESLTEEAKSNKRKIKKAKSTKAKDKKTKPS